MVNIKEIQGVLKKLGYYSGEIDGIYGPNTLGGVKLLQKKYGLKEDGIIQKDTLSIINSFLNGYDFYKIKKGDTIYKIGQLYKTDPYSIIVANEGINPYFLKVGEKIIVPYSFGVVQTNIDYSYEVLERNILSLKKLYPFLTIGSIGKSVLGRKLYYLKLGKGENKVFYNGAHHSLEWITSPLLMKFAEDFLKAYTLKAPMLNYDVSKIWNNSSIYIVPMVNPDGVDLVLNGLSKSNPNYKDLILWNRGSLDFSKTWQANNRGVDLNHNYDASFEESKIAEKALGIKGPGPTRYGGVAPETEPETKSIVKFTGDNNFRLVLAYHSQGEVIYWTYGDTVPKDSRKIGETLARVSGYKLDTPEGITSYGGYKDWFIKEFNRPGYTIEVGLGKNPLPIKQFNKIYGDNKEILLISSVI